MYTVKEDEFRGFKVYQTLTSWFGIKDLMLCYDMDSERVSFHVLYDNMDTDRGERYIFNNLKEAIDCYNGCWERE